MFTLIIPRVYVSNEERSYMIDGIENLEQVLQLRLR